MVFKNGQPNYLSVEHLLSSKEWQHIPLQGFSGRQMISAGNGFPSPKVTACTGSLAVSTGNPLKNTAPALSNKESRKGFWDLMALVKRESEEGVDVGFGERTEGKIKEL